MDSNRRLASLGLVMAMLFSALYLRVGLLTTVESEAQRREGEKFLRAVNALPATRGRILARDGRVLVDNLAVNVVKLDDSKIGRNQRVAVIGRLASVLNVPYSVIEGRLIDKNKPRFEAARIATNVKESVAIYIAENPELFPGATTEVTSQRVYPYGIFAPHVLGYLGRVNETDIVREPAELRYQPTELIGRAGVERSFERELRGIPGEEIITKNRLGLVVDRKLVREPIPGKDVRLTIDIQAQELIESTLRQGLVAARKNDYVKFSSKGVALSRTPIKAPAGAMVCMDVNNGEVVASASYPQYDPSEFGEGLSFKRAEELKAPDQHAPLINRVIEGQYPPGSTFKLVSALAALRYNLITTKTTYVDRGVFQIPDAKRLADMKRRKVRTTWKNAGSSVFGVIDLRNALRVSSDAFFYKIGYDFHINSSVENGIQRVASEMGLGKYTNIRLPQERRGAVPDRARTDRLRKKFPKQFGEWSLGATINVSIGQGEVLVTPLQLVRMYAALANGGTVLDARIDLEVLDRAETDARLGTSASAKPGQSDPDTVLLTPPPLTAESQNAIATTTSAAVTTTTTTPTAVASDAPSDSQAAVTTTIAPASSTTTTTPATRSILGVKVAPVPTLPPVEAAPAVEGHVDIPEDARATIVAGFQDVVSRKGGTAVNAFSGFNFARYPIAGKTGTAEKSGQQDYSLFVGFGPVNAPKYSCAAVIEEGGYGRQAGALVRRMFEGFSGVTYGPVRVVKEGGLER